MDQRVRDKLVRKLKDQSKALHHRLSGGREEAVNVSSSENKDEGDRANASISNELAALQQTQAENLLRAVNAALARVDDGTFGECRNCGGAIAEKRLEAIPWAQYCITCQELIDGH